MSYKRKNPPSLTPRNLQRRRQRHFRKLFTTHPVLAKLLSDDAVAKYISELEQVLADFYLAGLGDGTVTALDVTERAIRRSYSQS